MDRNKESDLIIKAKSKVSNGVPGVQAYFYEMYLGIKPNNNEFTEKIYDNQLKYFQEKIYSGANPDAIIEIMQYALDNLPVKASEEEEARTKHYGQPVNQKPIDASRQKPSKIFKNKKIIDTSWTERADIGDKKDPFEDD